MDALASSFFGRDVNAISFLMKKKEEEKKRF